MIEFNIKYMTDLFNHIKRHDLDNVKSIIGDASVTSNPLDNESSSFFYSCLVGSKEIVELHLKNNFDIDCRILDGLSALHLASSNRDPGVAELLLDRGMYVNIQESKGYTPLHFACLENNIPVVILLLKRNAAIDIKSDCGITPLDVASRSSNKELARILTAGRANPVLTNEQTSHDFSELYGLKYNIFVWQCKYDSHSDVSSTNSSIDLRLGLSRNSSFESFDKSIITQAASGTLSVSLSDESRLLRQAILERDLRKIEQYISLVDLNECADSTFLQFSVMKRDPKIITILLQNGANPNLCTPKHPYPIFLTTKYESMENFKVLLKYGAKILVLYNNNTLLQYARKRRISKEFMILIREEFLKSISLLSDGFLIYKIIEANKKYIRPIINDMLGIFIEHNEVTRLLIDIGADVNHVVDGAHILETAIVKNEKSAMALLEKGCNLNIEGLRDLAIQNNRKNVISFLDHDDTQIFIRAKSLMNDPFKFSEFYRRNCSEIDRIICRVISELILSDNIESLKCVVDKGIYNNLLLEDNLTLIMFAANYNKAEVIAMLADLGFDISQKKDDGTTALHIAVKHGYTDSIGVLLEHKPIIDDIEPLILLAYEHKHGAVGQYLREFSSDLVDRGTKLLPHKDSFASFIREYANFISVIGPTLYERACKGGLDDQVACIIENGMNLNYTYPGGVTPLHLACRYCMLPVVKFIISRGGDVHKLDQNNFPPIIYSAYSNNVETFLYLLKVGSPLLVNGELVSKKFTKPGLAQRVQGIIRQERLACF